LTNFSLLHHEIHGERRFSKLRKKNIRRFGDSLRAHINYIKTKNPKERGVETYSEVST